MSVAAQAIVGSRSMTPSASEGGYGGEPAASRGASGTPTDEHGCVDWFVFERTAQREHRVDVDD